MGLLLLFAWPLFAQQTQISDVDHYIQTKQYSKAKTLLLSNLDNGSSTALKVRLGDVHSYLMEWDDAISIYEKLIEKNPNNAEYQFKYGGAVARKAQNGSRLRALTLIGTIKSSFLNAVNLDKKHIDSRWGIIDYYVSVPTVLGGSYSKAYKYARELYAISPIEGHFALAYVYGLDEQPEKAEEHFRKTLKYIDGLGEVKRNQLNYLIGKVCGDYEQNLDVGIAHMQTFVKNNTVRDGVPVFHAYYQLARLYRLKNDRVNADVWIKRALSSDSNFQLAQQEKQIIDML